MPNQNVHRCVDVWVTKRDSKEPFRRTIAVSVQWRLPAQLSHKVGQKHHNGEERGDGDGKVARIQMRFWSFDLR